MLSTIGQKFLSGIVSGSGLTVGFISTVVVTGKTVEYFYPQKDGQPPLTINYVINNDENNRDI